uniref:Transposase n=1 Tax=Heterorhabditis bacteriophora TaxID=37862 RepID=A0A1I7W971_HETBA
MNAILNLNYYFCVIELDSTKISVITKTIL